MKKKINRSLAGLALLGLFFCGTGCQENESTTEINLNQEKVTLDAVSLSGTFTVNCSEAWGIYKGEELDWLTVSPATGSAGATQVSVSGTINRTANREALLTIRTASGENREIRIVQEVISKENAGTGTIGDIRAMTAGTISQNIRISGIVTSAKSNTDGKTLFLQSPAAPEKTTANQAIVLKFNEEYDLQTGEEVDVWVLDGKLEVIEKGLTQISNLPLDNIISHQMASSLPVPLPVSIHDLLEGGWDGQLVKVEGVEFMNIDATYAGEQKVWDEGKNELRVITEPTASFQNEKVAQGNGALIGNVSYLNGTPVLKMRSAADAGDMTGELIFGAFLVVAEEDRVLEYPQPAQSRTIHISASSGLVWNVSLANGEGWCTTDKTTGTGSGNLTLQITGNKGGERTATITITANKVSAQTITVTQHEINLIPNGNLELWSSVQLPDHWDYNQGSKPVTTDYQKAGEPHTGNACIQFTNFQNTGTSQTTGGYFVQEIPVQAGKTYRIAFWGKITGPNVRYRIYSRWRSQSGGGNLDSYHTDELRAAPYVDDTNNEWKQYSVTLTAPAEAKFFNFDVRPYCKNSGGASSSVFLDDFEIVEVAE